MSRSDYYEDDWATFDLLNKKAFDILFDPAIRRNLNLVDAFVILRNAAGHVIGIDSSVVG